MKNIKIIPEIICNCEKPQEIEMVYPIPNICNYCRKFIIMQRERPNEETTCNHNYIETLSEIDDHKTFQCLNCGKIQDRCDGPN